LSDDTDQLTGKAERAAFMGYEPRTPATEPEQQKTYPAGDAGITEAANDLTAARAAASDMPIDKLEYPGDEPGDKKWQTAEEAAKSLSDYHRGQGLVDEVGNLQNLAAEVDTFRSQVFGQQQPQQQSAEQPVEAPQPEAPPEASAPQGLDPDVQAALSNPKVRAAIEQPLLQAHQAQQAYTQGLTELAVHTTAYLAAEIPEFQGLNLQQIAASLDIMERQNPSRAAEIRQRFTAARSLAQEAQRVQQAAHVQQKQMEAAQWQNYVKANDDAFAKATANESPETMRAAGEEVLRACAEYGIDRNTVMALYQSDPVMRSAPFQKMMVDAAKFRMAQRTALANPASRDRSRKFKSQEWLEPAPIELRPALAISLASFAMRRELGNSNWL
jgi:hypothetical protein